MKTLFDLTSEDILILEDGEYRFEKNKRERRPGIGVVWCRQFRNIETGKVAAYLRNWELEQTERGYKIEDD